jgi:hypothetical protein
MLNHPNYTFSIPDKRLYTLFKGITVSPCFVQDTSLSSHGWAPFTRTPFISPSYVALYTSGALTCGALLWRNRGHHMRCPFGVETTHGAVVAKGDLRGLPYDPFLFSTGAFSTSRVPDWFAPSASKPRNAEPTAGRSSPVNSTHALQVKLAFLLNLHCTYWSPFV